MSTVVIVEDDDDFREVLALALVNSGFAVGGEGRRLPRGDEAASRRGSVPRAAWRVTRGPTQFCFFSSS
jgi:hypothetical protein